MTQNTLVLTEKPNASPEEWRGCGSGMSLKHATGRSFKEARECRLMPTEHYDHYYQLSPLIRHAIYLLYRRVGPVLTLEQARAYREVYKTDCVSFHIARHQAIASCRNLHLAISKRNHFRCSFWKQT